MRFGLENASKVIKNRRKNAHPVSPVSLCCRNLLNGNTNAQLIASPVNLEEHQWKSEMKISQGELFQLIQPTNDMFSNLIKLLWFVDSKSDRDPLTNDCLVKVSCTSVHNYYVHPSKCNAALMKLHWACEKNPALKSNIAKVLLGFCYRGMSLISIMKDLRTGDKPFKMLEHRKFCLQGKLPMLWDGFCDLVNSLLLPMADMNVIHLDIRSTYQFTYNILVYEEENKIELCLIDFDSVVLSSEAVDIDAKGQDDAICMSDSVLDQESAYQYLFWQVLWIAYRWNPPPSSVPVDTQRREQNANSFVALLFENDCYVEFKGWLGDFTETLKTMKDRNISRKDIEVVLKTFKEKCT